MSAIVGIVRFDGAAVERDAIDRAMGALAPFGPDGSDGWVGEGAALGHLLLRTTPEDEFDRQPAVGAGGAVLVFAGRVDNRDDLARTLGLRNVETTPDSAFVLAAFERFGCDFAREIVGDFALALWDPRERSLLLARDPCGMQSSLFYATGPGFFAFATLPAGLFPLGVPRAIDELKVAQLLCSLNAVDLDRSPYSGVIRLLPAHRLVATARGLRTARFFEFDLGRTLRLGSDDAYVEAFVEAYERAVEAQLRAAGPIGMLMSSGRDSSSVAALAARRLELDGRRLHAFTWAPEPGLARLRMPGAVLDETELAARVAAQYPAIEHHVFHAEGRTMMDVLSWQKPPFELPIPIGNFVWIDAGLEEARQRGIRVMLTGQYGNASVSWDGKGWLALLARRGQIGTLVLELRNHARAAGVPVPVALLREVVAPLSLGLRRRLHRGPWGPIVVARPLRDELRRRHGWTPEGPQATLTPIDERDGRADVHLTFQSDAIAARMGAYDVEWRDPTSDRRLRELSLAIPEEQHVRGGRGAQLLRRGLRGALPEEILEGPKLARQGGDFGGRFERALPAIRERLAQLETRPIVRRFVDWRALESLVAAQPTLSGDRAIMSLSVIAHVFSVGTFLESF